MIVEKFGELVCDHAEFIKIGQSPPLISPYYTVYKCKDCEVTMHDLGYRKNYYDKDGNYTGYE